MSKRVNQEKYELINTYAHQRIYPICSTEVEYILQIDHFLKKQSQFAGLRPEIRNTKPEILNSLIKEEKNEANFKIGNFV